MSLLRSVPDRGTPRAQSPSIGLSAIVSENVAGYSVVHVFGEVDLFTSPDLERAVGEAAAASETQFVVVDFSECRYLDSTTLSVLVRAKKALPERLRIVVPSSVPIRRLFEITNLAGVLNVASSLELAIR